MVSPLAVRVGASEWQAAFTSEYPEEQQPDWDAANEEAELLYGIGTENWQGETNGPENTTYPTLSDDDTNHPPVFDDGVILLYSFAQLQLVGSNQPLTQTDYDPTQLCSGTVVEDESGESVAYGADAAYRIAQGFELPPGTIWQLPAGFTGTFSASEASADRPLYDTQNDTIYLYHPYQLATMAMDDAEQQPVLSEDADADTFGMGQLIFPDGEDNGYLTYSATHRYVFTSQFSYQPKRTPLRGPHKAPATPSNAAAGRDYAGQVSKDIDGTTYILIGDRQQLDAITANDTTRTKVSKPVYKATEGAVEVWRTSAHITGDWIWLSEFDGSKELKDGNGYGTTAAEVIASYDALASGAQTVYPGDADLIGQFAQSPLYDVSSGSYHKLDRPAGTATSRNSTRDVYFTTNSTTGLPDITTAPLTAADPTEGTLRYEKNGNYIVFRDIDMSVGYNVTVVGGLGQWTPLMFTGTMYGAKTVSGEKLWNGNGIDDATEITATAVENRPSIRNLYVNKTDTLNVNEYIGIGFFATITNRSDAANIGVSGGKAIVKNLELCNVNVANNTSTAGVNQTLLNAVTSTLGTVLGGLLDGLLWVLSFGSANTDLNTTLSNLLNARMNDPTIFATGAFAGRIVGDVLVEDCLVTHDENGSIQVSNVKDRLGGFVGYMSGQTEYSGLSQALGTLTGVLAGILNVIPAVGLGDLITILLGNALPLNQLIPTGYESPLVKTCGIHGLSGDVGRTDRSMTGGFAGQQIGAHIEDSYIEDSTYHVKALRFGGGFSGIGRDAVIEGLLDGVGVDLTTLIRNIRNIHPQTVLTEDEIRDSVVNVSGTDYLGGFVGDLNNSYSIDCSIRKTDDFEGSVTVTVNGTGNLIGGYAGSASVGWGASLGKDENTTNSLLGTVSQLLTGLLSSDPAAQKQLLTIAGVAPSAIVGDQITVDAVTVQAGESFVGGILGKGDAVIIKIADSQTLTELAELNYGGPTDSPSNRPVLLRDLVSVTAGEDYAGGVAGYVSSASVGGLINDTASVGEFLGFSIRTVTVTGVNAGYTVTADHYDAGGGFGLAAGGTITNVVLQKLQRVEALNRAAGFVGIAGPGELVGTGGLTVNLLGLDRVLEVSNLLNVGQGMEVHITDSTVTGIDSGYTVEATGSNGANDVFEFTASGFIADSNSTKITNSHAFNLLSVIASNDHGYAGGFIGTSETGGLAEAANNDDTSVKALIEANGLVRAIGYLIPSYTNCTVHFIQDQGFVQADLAGGFVADFESGTVDNSSRVTLDENDEIISTDYYAVYDIDHVTGQTYGGGFGGRVVSGALASAGGGISILSRTGLNLDLSNLLSVMNAYVPYVKYAGVYSLHGFTVEAQRVLTTPGKLETGAAGGFIGYASGAQVSYSDVYRLKHTIVTPPDALEAVAAPSYFDNSSDYAVKGGRYAGGYVGNMDIGSAASIGEGLGVLGNLLNISNVVSALSVVVSTIEHSNVTGCPGGFAVRATGDDAQGRVGMSGGFAGAISGGHIQDSHAVLFSYIISQIAAGGYVGNFKPGDVAKLLSEAGVNDNGSLLGKLLANVADVNGGLATLIQSFVPTIRNSTTSCIPCGGAVRAHAPSDAAIQRGMAGGYCGHNEGGSIWGMDDHTWQTQNNGVGRVFGRRTDNLHIGSYTGPKHICKADRIRSVYGYEYAGGYTGLMEPASTANTGNIKLLGGLISANNLLSALNVVYPTEENTAIFGPLRHLDVATWNAWVTYVARYGGYGLDLAHAGTVQTEAELKQKIEKYVYGYHVVAGRPADALESGQLLVSEGGDAGGYVGLMVSGVITNGQAFDAKLVKAMRSAGGFVGRMKTGGAAEFGDINVLGLIKEQIGTLVQAAQVFVPAIKNSTVRGFQSGLTVVGDRPDFVHKCGYAGGYAGSVYGGQIWGDEDVDTVVRSAMLANDPNIDPDELPQQGCDVRNLRYVQGRNAVGGYVGLATAASVANVNTDAGSGLLQGVLNAVLNKTNGDLASVLQATMTTIRKARVSSAENDWGFAVEGIGGSRPSFIGISLPRYAGGFAGSLEAAVLGSRQGESELEVNGLRTVDAKYYAGGFFGIADVTSVADVAAKDEGENETTILGLIQLGNTSVLDAFRTYIYYADVNGVPEGLVVRAHNEDNAGMLTEERFSGCAGGFGGGLMNGTVTHSNVTNLNTVSGLNYNGGFIGHLGKNGVADVDNANVTGLLGLTAGVLDVFGSHVEDSTVAGINDGYVVHAAGGTEPIAGGFVGYADISRVKRSHATHLKQVTSEEIAGGFVGKTDMHYLVDAGVDSALVRLILQILNALLNILYIDGLENLDLIDLSQIPYVSNILGLKLLSDGDILYLNLLGLRVGVSLIKNTSGEGQDTAVITLGDSTISLPCSKEGGIDSEGRDEEIKINLIKGNRTKIEACSVTGIPIGYDVYAGGADNLTDGADSMGYAGGFVGYNHEGHLLNNEMIYCDVVRGTTGTVGHFSGVSTLQSVYSFNTMDSIEGENNRYHVYRVTDNTAAQTAGNVPIATATPDTGTSVTYQRFDVTHRASPIVAYSDWQGATMSGAQSEPILVYESAAKAVLMRASPTEDNGETLVPEPAEVLDPCEQSIDYTIQKIWDDLNDQDRIRPPNIQVRLLQSMQTEDGTPILNAQNEPLQTVYIHPTESDQNGYITLSYAADGRFGSAAWTHVAHDLPVAGTATDPDTGEEILVYYTYSVEELAVDGYFTTITYDESGFVATITNRHRPMLPETGGMTDWMFVFVGVGAVLLGAVTRKRRTPGGKEVPNTS